METVVLSVLMGLGLHSSSNASVSIGQHYGLFLFNLSHSRMIYRCSTKD